MRQYARLVEQALRPVMAGSNVPLILAATEPMDSIYRSVNSYPWLAATSIQGNPEATTDAHLAASARTVATTGTRPSSRSFRALGSAHGQGRTLTDVADIARAATFGAVDTVLVDIGTVVPGAVDRQPVR